MKNKSIKLSLLIFTMSVLISSRQDAGACNPDETLIKGQGALNKCSGYAASLVCKQKQAPAIEINASQTDALNDNELPLSPISRFIILQ